MGQETMDSGDTDVVDTAYIVAHEFGCDRGLFRDRNITGSGTDDRDPSLPQPLVLLTKHERAREFIVLGFAEFLAYGPNLLRRDASGEDIVPALGKASKYLRKVLWLFAGSENNFGHAGAERAMMIDLGEPEIFEWQMTQFVDGFVGGEFAVANLFEEPLQFRGVHKIRLSGSGRRRPTSAQ
jgi:hypothetical protein